MKPLRSQDQNGDLFENRSNLMVWLNLEEVAGKGWAEKDRGCWLCGSTLRCGVLMRFVNRNAEVDVQARCLHHLTELPSLAALLAP